MSTIIRAISDEAVISVSVADITIKPLHGINNKSAEDWHTSLSFSPETGRNACPRARQLLFNSRIHIIDETDYEVCFETQDFAYLYNDIITQKFWTLKQNIQRLSNLSEDDNSVRAAIPSHHYEQKKIVYDNNVVTLRTSLTLLGTHYSAGTRFTMVSNDTSQEHDIECIQIAIPNYTTHQVNYVAVPTSDVILPQNRSIKEMRQLLVDIVYEFAQQKNTKVMPYLWGGCSMGYRLPDTFYLEEEQDKKHGISYWLRPHQYKTSNTGHMGCDCSGLILLAAKMAGFEYVYNNTTTMNLLSQQLELHENLQMGDLIIHRGHVIIVSSLERNEAIEAVGYGSGYGCIHAMPLEKYFQNITTYEQLIDHYHQQKPLIRLDKKGNVRSTITEFKLLKLYSE